MNIRYVALLLWSILLGNSSLQGQDAEFSQFYAAPVYTNGAMIGFAEVPRVTFNVRNQMASFAPDAFITSSISYDQYFYPIRSSVGLTFTADIAGNLLNTYELHGQYAYTLPLTDKIGFKMGLQAGVIQQNINESNLVFGDMINPNSVTDNISNATNELPLLDTKATAFDVGAGFVVYSSDFFFGGYFKHLNTPTLSYTNTGSEDNENQIDIRTSVQIGKTFYLNDPFLKNKQTYITPALLFVHQGNFIQINGGAYVGKGPIFGGFWFRHTIHNSDALIAMIGFKKGIFKAGYSHDFNLGKIKTNAGAHELSLSIDLGQDPYNQKKARMQKNIKCPEMFVN